LLTSDVPKPHTVLPEISATTPPSVLNQQTKRIVPGDKPPRTSYVEQLSWEYLMPKRKERMAGYIRESDPSLADSTTIESQARAVREYGEKEGYIYEPQHEYKEAISAYQVHYMERRRLLDLLESAKRREFDVLVVTEVRAISRRQVEVFIIYDMLQKYGARLETVKEKFEDDAMGRLILGLRAAYAEIEREQSYVRLQRGRKDRIEIGKAPNGHSKAAYGYIFVDTDREVKGRYEFNHAVIYIDEDGIEWSEYKVMVFIFDLLKRGESLYEVARILNAKGIPTPKKKNRQGGAGLWQRGTILRIITNPIYIGEVWANRYTHSKSPKTNRSQPKLAPREQWVLLPEGTAPALIDEETWEAVQKQLQINKEESMRNNTHGKEEFGLLRAGYIYCGVCGRRMHVSYPAPAAIARGASPWYRCQQKSGISDGHDKHRTQIHVPFIDAIAREKIVEILNNPSWVRARVEELRSENKPPVISAADIEEAIEKIRLAMKNLYTLAEHATDDETIANLTARMNDLENQKREAERWLYDLEDDDEERQAIEAEIVKFEKWAAEMQPYLTDPSYVPSYKELRLAVRIIGVKLTVFPTLGDWPCRYQIDVTVPEIMKKLGCVNSDPRLLRPISA
jgi:site-specific DNA recombinase